jgi:hypothetical protein
MQLVVLRHYDFLQIFANLKYFKLCNFSCKTKPILFQNRKRKIVVQKNRKRAAGNQPAQAKKRPMPSKHPAPEAVRHAQR